MVARKRIGGAALPKSADGVDDPVALGREAWGRRKADARASWHDWKLIGEALAVGRKESMAKAKADRPAGRKYNELFGHWIQIHGFHEIDKADRAKLLRIIENLDDVEAWRKTLTESQRTQINHPSSVWRAWTCPNRGNRGKANSGEDQPSESGAAATTQHDDSDDEEAAEVKWQRGLLLRAHKAIGDAHLKDLWALPEPPDPGLIAVVRKAADAWTKLAEYLEQAGDMSPEELSEARESYAENQRMKAKDETRKKARRRQEAEHAWAQPN